MIDATGLRYYINDQALANSWEVDYTNDGDKFIITIWEKPLEMIPAKDLEYQIRQFIGRDNRDDLEDTDFWKYLGELVRRAS